MSVARLLAPSRVLPAVKIKALIFDGVDDYVTIPHSTSLDITDKITIATWVKPMTSMDDKSILCKRAGAPNWWAYGIRANDDKFSGRFSIGGEVKEPIADTAYTIDTWYHVATTYDRSHVKLYINSILQSRILSATDTIDSVTHNIFVGSWDGSQKFSNSLIGEVRIYNRALTQEEILYNKEHPYNPILRGCVLWLGADSIEPPTWRDKSGQGNDGTIYGATVKEMNKFAGRVLSV